MWGGVRVSEKEFTFPPVRMVSWLTGWTWRHRTPGSAAEWGVKVRPTGGREGM